ncbi:MAG: signal peptidase II [Firmicutes bacterium]|nr:signal peptidase II [Bacillota bacterium]
MSCWLAPAAFLLDRVTKAWAVSALKGNWPEEVWPGVLRFVYVENTGAAFGVLGGRQGLLIAVTGAALAGLLIWLFTRGRSAAVLPRAALWLFLGGSLGNFFDRLAYGYVIDFMEIRLFTFPVFNIADTTVCVVFALLTGYIIFHREAKPDGG